MKGNLSFDSIDAVDHFPNTNLTGPKYLIPDRAELGHSVFRREILVEAVQICRLAHGLQDGLYAGRKILIGAEPGDKPRAKWNVIVLSRILGPVA